MPSPRTGRNTPGRLCSTTTGHPSPALRWTVISKAFTRHTPRPTGGLLTALMVGRSHAQPVSLERRRRGARARRQDGRARRFGHPVYSHPDIFHSPAVDMMRGAPRFAEGAPVRGAWHGRALEQGATVSA